MVLGHVRGHKPSFPLCLLGAGGTIQPGRKNHKHQTMDNWPVSQVSPVHWVGQARTLRMTAGQSDRFGVLLSGRCARWRGAPRGWPRPPARPTVNHVPALLSASTARSPEYACATATTRAATCARLASPNPRPPASWRGPCTGLRDPHRRHATLLGKLMFLHQ